MEILQNTCLISAVLAWAAAQLCKLLIELIAHHRLDWSRLTGDGGMPSGHSATVTALAAAALLQYGAASFQFAISAVLAIIVRNSDAVAELNALLHQYGEHIIGRMGLPCRERGLSLISVALDAPGDVISALSGKIGRLPGVTAKTVYAPGDALR